MLNKCNLIKKTYFCMNEVLIFALLEKMNKDSSPKSISKLLKFYLQFILILIALTFLFAILFIFLVDFDSLISVKSNDKAFMMLSIVIPQVFIFLIPSIVFAYRAGSIKKSLYLQWKFPVIWLLPILIGWLALDMFSSALISLLIYVLPESASAWLSNELYKVDLLYRSTFGTLGNDLIGISLIILSGAVIPAFCEEFLFRGTFLSKTLEYISPYKTLSFTSLLFAIVHLQLITIPQLFIFGFYLGIVVLITKSIYPAIIIHFINNAAAFISLIFGESSHLSVIQDNNDLIKQIGLLLLSFFVAILAYKYFFKSKCRFEHQGERTSHT